MVSFWGVLTAGITSVLSPPAARLSPYALIVMRFVNGLGQVSKGSKNITSYISYNSTELWLQDSGFLDSYHFLDCYLRQSGSIGLQIWSHHHAVWKRSWTGERYTHRSSKM